MRTSVSKRPQHVASNCCSKAYSTGLNRTVPCIKTHGQDHYKWSRDSGRHYEQFAKTSAVKGSVRVVTWVS